VRLEAQVLEAPPPGVEPSLRAAAAGCHQEHVVDPPDQVATGRRSLTVGDRQDRVREDRRGLGADRQASDPFVGQGSEERHELVARSERGERPLPHRAVAIADVADDQAEVLDVRDRRSRGSAPSLSGP